MTRAGTMSQPAGGADRTGAAGIAAPGDVMPLRWLGIVRLGLVQAALGAVVVLVTSTLNRVMVVEYSLPAVLPGVLVALHYAVQMIRPRFGHGSDVGGRRTPWIIGGMALLAVGGVSCSVATGFMEHGWGVAFAVASYVMVGLGVGAAGTSLLALMADRVDDRRRAAAATIMWILMIAGFAVTSTAVGHLLDPFTPQRLIRVTAMAAGVAFLVAVAAIWRVEATSDRGGLRSARGRSPDEARRHSSQGGSFAAAIRRVWSEPNARGFTLFVFVSMLAYSAQELLLEPFCGLVFGYSLGESARVSGSWHAAALVGMIAVGIACSGTRRLGSLKSWTIGGCCASAAALLSLAGAALVAPSWPLHAFILALGLANGIFAVSAIGSMMELAHRGEARSAGVRMGLWGAAQAIAFALGGLLGNAIVDALRLMFGSPALAFAVVFGVEATLFLAAARLAARAHTSHPPLPATNATAVIA
jgi:BCD family chlorophyll transporter-like MFS transporter